MCGGEARLGWKGWEWGHERQEDREREGRKKPLWIAVFGDALLDCELNPLNTKRMSPGKVSWKKECR